MNDTKTKILDTAEDLIQHVGVNAMSYKHIAEAVGIRKASIHHHFSQKEKLVNELLERCQISYGEQYKDIVRSDENAPTKLQQLALVYERGVSAGRICLVGSMSSDRNTLHGDSCKILDTTIQKTITTFTEVFEQGKRESSLSFTESSEEAASAYFSFLVGAQIIALSLNGVEGFRKSVRVIIDAYVS